MTREEAKKILKIADKRYITLYPEERQAICMAIEALEQEPLTDVLDKIKADVEEQVVPRSVYTDKQKKQVLAIIDKYKTDMVK